VESPLVCVSGVTGADLKKRIEEIMANRMALKLNAGRRLLLAGAGALAVILPVAIGLLNAPPIRAQAQPGKALAFEVASVKAFATTDRASMTPPTALPGGRFVSKFPLAFVISYAYKLPFNRTPRLSGIPDELGRTMYDIEATATMPTGLSVQAREDRTRMMLQTLLADRFKMAMHKETKEMPVYALVVGKGGPKLQKADIGEKDCPDASLAPFVPGPSTPDPDTCHSINGGQGRGLHARAVNMADVVSYVENWTGRPFLDKTGIQGLFHIQTRPWQPMDAGAPPPGAKADDGSDLADVPTLFQVFEGLGLKMEARNDKADVYVVDHIEKPSEN
jgi:bla regulator protein BlaR1